MHVHHKNHTGPFSIFRQHNAQKVSAGRNHWIAVLHAGSACYATPVPDMNQVTLMASRTIMYFVWITSFALHELALWAAFVHLRKPTFWNTHHTLYFKGYGNDIAVCCAMPRKFRRRTFSDLTGTPSTVIRTGSWGNRFQ